jgi:lipopolysaccharide export LptBFGC system permease protein LptF
VVINLDEFTEEHQAGVSILAKIADFHGYRVPLYFHQLGGVVMSIAAAFTFAILLRNNELTPLVAAGVPLQRLAVPVLMSSVVLVAVWLANSEVVLPAFATKIARHHDDLNLDRQTNVPCVRDDSNTILWAFELNPRAGWLRGVYLVEPNEDRKPTTLISADSARYDANRGVWLLERGARWDVGDAFAGGALGHAIRKEPIAEYHFSLTPEQILLRQSAEWADLMSIRQMNGLLQSRNLPNLPAVARARDIRFSQPLLMWILILLAIPFFLTREPTHVLVAGGKALLLTGICFAFTFTMHSVPYAQLWIALPVLAFGPAAVLHLANVKT